MQMCANLDQILPAAFLQVLVVLASCAWFGYLRLGAGAPGRYLVMLASGWLILGVMYLLHASVCSFFAVLEQPITEDAARAWQVVDSTLSLFSSTLLVVAWYLMRDYRLEVAFRAAEEGDNGVPQPGSPPNTSPDPARASQPTMTKSFVTAIIVGSGSLVSAYIVFLQDLIDSPRALTAVLQTVDVTFAAAAVCMVGWEFLLMRIPSDDPERGFFGSDAHLIMFKTVTFMLFTVWGLAQFFYLFSLRGAGPFFTYPYGPYFDYLAVLKLMCAATGGVLAMHSLPSERWVHWVHPKRKLQFYIGFAPRATQELPPPTAPKKPRR